MRSEWYRQCRLRDPTTNRIDVSWIREEIAKVGTIVRIRLDAGSDWEIWLVEEVWGREKYANLDVRSRDWIKQRRASDV